MAAHTAIRSVLPLGTALPTANTAMQPYGAATSPAVEIPATGSTPETEDNRNMFLWIALLSVSGFGVVTIIVYVYVKKRQSVK